MREPVMDAAFGQLIQKFLCYESYAFLKEVDQYEKEVMGNSSLKQHSTFNTIVAKYLVPGSPQEVNISNTMRSGILNVVCRSDLMYGCTKRQMSNAVHKLRRVASSLKSDRQAVFLKATDEVRHMLDLNLIGVFQGKHIGSGHSTLTEHYMSLVAQLSCLRSSNSSSKLYCTVRCTRTVTESAVTVCARGAVWFHLTCPAYYHCYVSMLSPYCYCSEPGVL
eukprot:18055-Heterococcus_DN1.PRE.6